MILNIKVIVHIINGLPGEDYNMMMETAKAVANMGVDGIKIHLLHVIKDTPMERMLEKGMLTLMDKDEYINLVCDQLEIPKFTGRNAELIQEAVDAYKKIED